MMRATLLALACLLTSGRAVHLIQLSAPAPHTESFQLTPNFIRNVLDMDVMNPAIVASPGAYRRVAPQQSVTYTRAIAPAAKKRLTQHMPMKVASTGQGISSALLRNLMDLDVPGTQGYIEIGGTNRQPTITYSRSVAPASLPLRQVAQHMPMSAKSTSVSIPRAMLRNMLDLDVHGAGLARLAAYDTQALPQTANYGAAAYNTGYADQYLLNGGRDTVILG